MRRPRGIPGVQLDLFDEVPEVLVEVSRPLGPPFASVAGEFGLPRAWTNLSLFGFSPFFRSLCPLIHRSWFRPGYACVPGLREVVS